MDNSHRHDQDINTLTNSYFELQSHLASLRMELQWKEEFWHFNDKHCRRCKFVNYPHEPMKLEYCGHKKAKKFVKNEKSAPCILFREKHLVNNILSVFDKVCGYKGRWFELKEKE